VRRLVWPERIESIELQVLGRRDQPEWPPFDRSAFGIESELEAGEEHVWFGVAPTAPPRRLALTGWIWSRKVDLRLRPDASLARELPRLVTADDETMSCSASAEHRSVALASGFLAPGLVFRVPGTGDAVGIGGGGFEPDCSNAVSLDSIAAHTPDRDELPRAVVEAVLPCGLVVDPHGGIVARIETQRNEILDVVIEGADERRRGCAAEALWSSHLPEKFNLERWRLEAYSARLTIAPAAAGGPGH
jgi:hypothetical protein